MYSILIVDDERFMREGIKKLLPWEQIGINHVDTAESAISALNVIKKHMPDIILTDIEMENMNGIELIRELNTMNPDLRIIVLTAHDDFRYVQECCRMEVHDYLLKPVDKDNLTEVIRKQVNKLDFIKSERSKQKEREKVTSLYEQMRVENIFQRFLSGEKPFSEIEQVLNDYHWNHKDGFQVAAIFPEEEISEEWLNKYEARNLSIRNTCINTITSDWNGIVFKNQSAGLILLLFQNEEQSSTDSLLQEIHSLLQENYHVDTKILIGEKVNTIEGIRDSYKSVIRMWREPKDDSADIIEQAKKYIAQHLDEELTVNQLASKYYLSVAYFSKLFKKNAGVNCNHYIMTQRMEKAKSLLLRKNLRVSEIAERVGYKDVNYFSMTFKKYTGMTPAEFREQ